MFSQRFQLPVVITIHASERMAVRNMDEALLLEIIETGVDKDAGGGHHWIYKHFSGRQDNLLCLAAVVDNVCRENGHAPLEDRVLKSVYFEDDDILQIRVSNKPIVREMSQGWNNNISYAQDGSIVEIILLNAMKEGLLPVEFKTAD